MKNKLIMIVSVAGMCLLAGCGKDAKVEEAAVNQAEEQTPIKEEETPVKEEDTPQKEEEIKPDETPAKEEAPAKEDTGKADDGVGKELNIPDGDYLTDETYKGDITADGSTLTVETALSHYNEDDWTTIKDYDKDTFVFKTSKDCKCVIYQEDVEEYPVAEQVDFINEFLHGNSGLPITLKIRNNELVEIGFSS